MQRKITRRQIARHLGLVAGGASVLGAGVAHALVATPRQVEGPFYPPEPIGEADVDLTLLEGHAEAARPGTSYSFVAGSPTRPASRSPGCVSTSGRRITGGATRTRTTQMYFEGDPLLADDFVFNAAPEESRHLLVTRPAADPDTGIPVHRFDIVFA